MQKAREAVAAIAQQRFAAAQAAIAQLSDADVLVATPDTLLGYISVNQQYTEALSQMRGSSSSSDGDDSESESESDDSTSTGNSDSINPGDLLRFDQLYWFVADESGLREAVQQQLANVATTGDDSSGDELFRLCAPLHRCSLLRGVWSNQLSRVATHLRIAEVDHEKYPVAGEVEMSEASRMVYLAEVSLQLLVIGPDPAK